MTIISSDVSKEDQIGNNSNKVNKELFLNLYVNIYKELAHSILVTIIISKRVSPFKRIRTIDSNSRAENLMVPENK